MGYCLSCGKLSETTNGLCSQCYEDESLRKPKLKSKEGAMTFEELESSANSCNTPMAKAMRRAIRVAKVFGACWW